MIAAEVDPHGGDHARRRSRSAVLGADGWRGGWIAARLGGRGDVRWLLLDDASTLVGAARRCAAAAVDAPIGLAEDGPRDCDRLARARLGPRRSSVFPAPVRAALGRPDHASANAASRVASGRGLSVQVWNICARIEELDDALGDDPDVLAECHPELAFALMTGAPLPSKKTAEGLAARVAALSGWLPDAAGVIAARPAGPRLDDALDALACAWTARRLLAGRALLLPEQAPRDRRGRLMRIAA